MMLELFVRPLSVRANAVVSECQCQENENTYAYVGLHCIVTAVCHADSDPGAEVSGYRRFDGPYKDREELSTFASEGCKAQAHGDEDEAAKRRGKRLQHGESDAWKEEESDCHSIEEGSVGQPTPPQATPPDSVAHPGRVAW